MTVPMCVRANSVQTPVFPQSLILAEEHRRLMSTDSQLPTARLIFGQPPNHSGRWVNSTSPPSQRKSLKSSTYVRHHVFISKPTFIRGTFALACRILQQDPCTFSLLDLPIKGSCVLDSFLNPPHSSPLENIVCFFVKGLL